MIDVKEAVLIAKQKASEVLGQAVTTLEEIEREEYKGLEVWSITLSYPRGPGQISPLSRLSADPLQYKRFLVDAETSELHAIKVREFAAP